MIVAIGFRVHSNIGTNFRKWANERITEYITKGFTLNDDLLKNAGGGIYFDKLLSRRRDIRSSEKVFWKKILDIYATSIDYDSKAEITQKFFKTIQNKMHWAAHGHTAAEIIVERANSNKDFMRLTNFNGDIPTLYEASIANWVKELDYFLKMNRKDILNGPGTFSHEEALKHARIEYFKYKDRLALKPSDVEIEFLKSINELYTIENK